MHKRTQEERTFGRWVVIVNGTYERFFRRIDAEEYKQNCISNGLPAYIHEITSDLEDDNFGYYFE